MNSMFGSFGGFNSPLQSLYGYAQQTGGIPGLSNYRGFRQPSFAPPPVSQPGPQVSPLGPSIAQQGPSVAPPMAPVSNAGPASQPMVMPQNAQQGYNPELMHPRAY